MYQLKAKKLLKHPALQNILWLMLERAFQILGGIFVSGLVARHFGVALFGQWQYAQSMIAIAMALTWICGAEVIVPKLSAKQMDDGRILGTAFVIRFVVSLVVAVGFYVLIPFLFAQREVQIVLLGLGLSIVFREPSMVAFAWFQSQTHTKPALLINVFALLLKVLLVAFLVRVDAPLIYFAFAWAFESVLVGVLLVGHLMRSYRPKLVFDRGLAFDFVRAGLFIWVGLVAMYALFRIDRIFLERFLTPELYGYYAASAQLNENWIAIGAMLAQSVSPIFVYGVSSKDDVRKNICRLVGLTALISILGAIFLYFVSPFVIRLVFGGAYGGAVDVFKQIVWLSLIVNVEAMLNTLVLKHNASRFFAFKWLSGLILSAVLCSVLIPVLGSSGAILSLYVSMFYVLLMTLIFIWLTGLLKLNSLENK